MPRTKVTKRRKRGSRIFTRRDRAGTLLYYGDFRDLGGGREALKPSGKVRGRATSDPDVAEKLCADRVAELVSRKHRGERRAVGLEKPVSIGLKAFAADHLVKKARGGKVTESWLARTQAKLELAIEYFGANRELSTISVTDLQGFVLWLQERPGRRGNAALSGGTLRHYLNAMSNLFRRAQAAEIVPPGFNPVSAMLEKPSAKREEARWLEVYEAALLIESARLYRPTEDNPNALPFMHAVLATFLLTGGRKNEVLGLEVGDVNFARKTVTFRVNQHRRLKTLGSARVVPLWPQLEKVLRSHLAEHRIAGGLMFPSPATGTIVVELRKALDTIAARGGWKPGEIRTKAFRHTYCSARLQTLDGGHPVSPFTVARELGHGGMSLVNRVYGHLGTVRHRSAEVEYRLDVVNSIEDQTRRKEIKQRMKALRVG